MADILSAPPDSGVVFETHLQYQQLAFPVLAQTVPPAPVHPQPEITRAERHIRWAPAFFFTPQHEASEGSTTGWRGSAPDWIARRDSRWTDPLVSFVPSPDATQAGWAPIYPDKLDRRTAPVSGDWAFNPFPIASTAAPDQPYHQPEWPVQPRRVAWALPWLAWTPQHQDAEGATDGWRGYAPEWVARSAQTFGPSGAFIASPDAIQAGWRPEYPDRIIGLTRLTLGASVTVTAGAIPDLPWREPVGPVRLPLGVITSTGGGIVTVPAVPDQFWVRPPDPTRRIARTTWTEFDWNPTTPVTPVPDIPLTSPVFPVWSKQWHPSRQIESRGPIAPLPTPHIYRVVGIVGGVWEQSCASYIATLRDPQGKILPGSILQTLRLTLYTVNRDNTFSIVNSRQHQPCLNINDVMVYDVLQTAADGRRFNLRWKMQPADTTMVDPALPFERHMMLWEYSWSAGHGKHEATVVVHNLSVVN